MGQVTSAGMILNTQLFEIQANKWKFFDCLANTNNNLGTGHNKLVLLLRWSLHSYNICQNVKSNEMLFNWRKLASTQLFMTSSQTIITGSPNIDQLTVIENLFRNSFTISLLTVSILMMTPKCFRLIWLVLLDTN